MELHPDKTRLIEFGPFAAQNRRRRGQGKPETFDFLGFTHICGTKWSDGRFTVLRQTMRERLQAKLGQVKTELRRRLHDPVPEVGSWLRSVVGGHLRYYGVPTNSRALRLFRLRVGRLWYRSMRRRSQKTRLTWERMSRLLDHWLPPPRVCHPYPLHRLGVILRQEPGAVVPLAGICGGGDQRWSSLLQLFELLGDLTGRWLGHRTSRCRGYRASVVDNSGRAQMCRLSV